MIYLRKANSDVVNHCKCADGYVSAPAQMDCPWCGCGWLFTCSDCRKAFTFAEAVEVDFTLEEMARRDFQHWNRPGTAPRAEDIQGWVDFMQTFLRGVEAGQRYVYLDGVVIPTDVDGLTFKGIHSSHDLAVVPQVEALRDQSIIRDLLSNPRYWNESALQRDESRPSA
ncbi:MAG: hypothetical protein JNL10_07410 [Verrucomicrobiales bacterium]|nr:hypothetical protein [Verrucomicrobiales bacterium]